MALVRVRLGVPADVATDSLWHAFRVIPSDIAGYPGPVRMVFLHQCGSYFTALPWAVPPEIVTACLQACEIQAVFEEDAGIEVLH